MYKLSFSCQWPCYCSSILACCLIQGQTGIESLTPRYPFINGNSNKRFAAFESQHQMMHAQGQHTMQASTAKTKPSVGPMILHRHGLSVFPISIHNGKKNIVRQPYSQTLRPCAQHCRKAKELFFRFKCVPDHLYFTQLRSPYASLCMRSRRTCSAMWVPCLLYDMQ